MYRLWMLLVLGVVGVNAGAAILLRDDFAYADGALTNVSSSKWLSHGGTPGEVNVLDGRVELNRAETEDVSALLAGGPIVPTGAGVVYARFNLTLTELPTGSGGVHFAHFNGSSSQRGRIFVTANGAGSGTFRIGVGNSGGSPSRVWPVDLLPSQTYTVMTRYVVSNAVTTLWINPASDTSLSITGLDLATPAPVSAFAWRQDRNMGVLLVDDLFVTTSFGEALNGDASPGISAVPRQQVAAGGRTRPIPFVISDPETAAEALGVWASSSDTNLVPSITVVSNGSNCTVSLGMAPQLLGEATITLCTTDGSTTNCSSFLLSALPALLFADDFAYAGGALISNAAPTWVHHSGGTGEIQVVNGQLAMGVPYTEDVHTVLPFGPFPVDSGLTFYVSMWVRFTELPGTSGDYVAHFNAPSGRGRLIANTFNAAAGKFRLAVANANVALAQPWGVDLALNTNYLVVLRYEAATALSTLWVNPLTESSPGTNATDVAVPAAISAFAFRESASIGKITVDDLRVGLTFDAVTISAAPRLKILCLTPELMQISWPVAPSGGYRLQSNAELNPAGWYDVDELPVIVGDECVVTKPVYGGAELFRLRRLVPVQ